MKMFCRDYLDEGILTAAEKFCKRPLIILFCTCVQWKRLFLRDLEMLCNVITNLTIYGIVYETQQFEQQSVYVHLKKKER